MGAGDKAKEREQFAVELLCSETEAVGRRWETERLREKGKKRKEKRKNRKERKKKKEKKKEMEDKI